MTWSVRLLAIGAAASALAGPTAHAQEKLQKELRAHATSSTVSLRLFADVGGIRVVGWDRDSVEMSGTVPAGTRFEMATGSPSNAPAGVKMFVELPGGQAARDSRLVLRVPHGARVWLKTGSADIDVSGVTGGVDANVVGGSITVHGSPRELRAESMDGNILVDGAPEWVRAKTATGDIELHGGQDVGASTISGTIRSSGGEVERLRLEATTGGISLSSSLARGASVELETHSGPIDLSLPGRGDVDVDVATITGAIDNQWTRARPVAGKEGRGMTLTAQYGMANSRIVVRSFKGTVQLHIRQ